MNCEVNDVMRGPAQRVWRMSPGACRRGRDNCASSARSRVLILNELNNSRRTRTGK